jgi:hypothetical protein
MSSSEELGMSNINEEMLTQLLTTTPEGAIALLIVILDRQGAIELDTVRNAINFFDEKIPYAFTCVKGGINKYKEIIDLLKKGESVEIRDCSISNIKKSLSRAGILAEVTILGRGHYLLRPKVVSSEQRGE